jgi:hypothetical protein
MLKRAAALLLFLLAAAPSSGGATGGVPATEVVEAAYVVRWGGMEIGRFDAELRRTGVEYHLAYRTRTSGALAWVVDFDSTGWAAGRLDDAGVAPRHFRGESRWRDGDGFWRVSFGGDGRVTELELDEATRADREPVPDALRTGPDPLSLMLQAMHVAAAGERVEGRSFDGRRAMRYALACAVERSAIRPAALGGGAHAALLCEADGALVAGRSKRWSDRPEAGEQDRPPARIWLVPGLGGLPHWPVRIEATSRYGTVTVELERITDPAA